VKDIDLGIDQLQQATSCPITGTVQPGQECTLMEERVKQAGGHNKIRTTQRTGVLHTYMNALTCYYYKIKKVKRSSWRKYCQGIAGVASSCRLIKVMATRQLKG
jgi:hypothetical protein